MRLEDIKPGVMYRVFTYEQIEPYLEGKIPRYYKNGLAIDFDGNGLLAQIRRSMLGMCVYASVQCSDFHDNFGLCDICLDSDFFSSKCVCFPPEFLEEINVDIDDKEVSDFIGGLI